MKEQFISVETAKLAKDKEFVEACEGWYSFIDGNPLRKHPIVDYVGIEDCYLAPTQSLLQKWLREKFNLNVFVLPVMWGDVKSLQYSYVIYIDNNNNNFIEWTSDRDYGTYEEALEDGLYRGLNVI